MAITAITIEIPEDVAERLRSYAAESGEDMNRFAVVSIQDALDRAEGRREGQRLLHGPGQVFDREAIMLRFREKYGLPDLSRLSPEERADYAESALNEMTPEQRANAERLGFI